MLLARTDKGQLVEGYEVRHGARRKNAILTLIEGSGSARSLHVESAKKQEALPIVRVDIARQSHVMTDEALQHAELSNEFAKHGSGDRQRCECGSRENQRQDRERMLRHPQARYDQCLSTLRRATFAPLARGI
jgi:hypothetical protein